MLELNIPTQYHLGCSSQPCREDACRTGIPWRGHEAAVEWDWWWRFGEVEVAAFDKQKDLPKLSPHGLRRSGEPNSLLCDLSIAGGDVRMVDIMKWHDFPSELGMTRAMDALRTRNGVLWFSAPCTGESGWQELNIKWGGTTEQEILRPRNEFARLWKAFARVLAHAEVVKARVFVEPPAHCGYWRWPRVQRVMQKYGLQFARFDGCIWFGRRH